MTKTTIASLSREITTEAEAYSYLEHLRWGDSPICAHCHGSDVFLITPKNGVSRATRTGAQSERRVWKCRECGQQFSVLTGTIMHRTKISVRTWVLVFFEFVASKNGMAAREVERKYGVCPRTAWFMLQRIREAMTGDGPLSTMRGTIVADETWVGGDPGNRHNRKFYSNFSTKTDKTTVFSLINAGTGEVRSRVVPNVTGHMMRKAIAEQVDVAGSVLHTDAAMHYRQLGQEFLRHEWVDHSAREYVRGDVSTNRAEGYFAQLKRSLDGTHHHVSKTHLSRYLAEFDFRYLTCKVSDAARMAHLLGQVEGRLTYKRVKRG
jgi:transposase-like protein